MGLQERDCQIMLWLNHLGFSHLDNIRDVFFKGCNLYRSPYRRMLKLVKGGFIKTVKVYSDPRPLYILTRFGLEHLRSVGFRYCPALPKDERFRHYEHDYGLIKFHIFALEMGLGAVIPERVIRSVKPRGSVPDAVLMTADANYAIEYERTFKEFRRYNGIFRRYDANPKYDAMLYIFPTESKVDKFRKRLEYIHSKLYCISEEKLYQEKANAIFYSCSDGLPLKHLIKYSRGNTVEGIGLDHLDPKELRDLVCLEPSEDWKDKKPSWGGGGGSRRKQEAEDAEHEEYMRAQSEESADSGMYPSIYPNGLDDFYAAQREYQRFWEEDNKK